MSIVFLKFVKVTFFSLFFLHLTLNGELNKTQIYTSLDPTCKNALVEEINKAKESLLFFSFTFSEKQILSLINKKVEEGLLVTVILDKDHLTPLQRSADPRIKILTRNGQGRIHHKILVVDRKTIWLGSANFTHSAFTNQENLILTTKNPYMAEYLHNEARVFEGLSARRALMRDEKDNLELFLLPSVKPYEKGIAKELNILAKKQLLDLIAQAKEKLQIAMMVWTDKELMEAVIEAHNKGISVEIVLQDSKNDVYQIFKEKGMSVKTCPLNTFMHNKFMLVDETVLINGSANWSYSAFSRNDESFFLLHSLDTEQENYLKAYWNRLFQ